MVYRIYTDNGHVDTAFDIDVARHKFKIYKNLMHEKYSNFVKMTIQCGIYGIEKEILAVFRNK